VNRSFDEANGYRTMSVLAVPMRDHEEAIVGVIMLINRKPEFGMRLTSPAHTEEVVGPFSERDEHVLSSLASQAGVAFENKTLLESIENLFEQFVRASVKAIEVRDKSTQGHSSRVADLTVLQAEAVNAIDSGIFADLHFDVDQLREMRYASLLHDFGKVAVPEYIFGKAKKLPDGRIDAIRLRFLLAIEQTSDDALRAKLRELLVQVEHANEPRVISMELGDVLDRNGGRFIWGPGRHGPGNNVFCYFLGPEAMPIELTAEMQQIDASHRAKTPDDWKWPPGRLDHWGIGPGPSERMDAAGLRYCFTDNGYRLDEWKS